MVVCVCVDPDVYYSAKKKKKRKKRKNNVHGAVKKGPFFLLFSFHTVKYSSVPARGWAVTFLSICCCLLSFFWLHTAFFTFFFVLFYSVSRISFPLSIHLRTYTQKTSDITNESILLYSHPCKPKNLPRMTSMCVCECVCVSVAPINLSLLFFSFFSFFFLLARGKKKREGPASLGLDGKMGAICFGNLLGAEGKKNKGKEREQKKNGGRGGEGQPFSWCFFSSSSSSFAFLFHIRLPLRRRRFPPLRE